MRCGWSISAISAAGCQNYTCVDGDPKVIETPAAADTSTYFNFGSLDWAQLTAMANKILSGNIQGIGPTVANGTCNVADFRNFGEPVKTGQTASPCENYYPIIYSPGSLTLNTGRGQGILLVEGDLEVQGGFEFYGPVIVRGTLKTAGQGGHFNGGVMAANVQLDQNVVIGNAVISFSRCTILKALNGSATPTSAIERSWFEVY